MDHLAEQAGVDYAALSLDAVAETAARVFRSLGAFAAVSDDRDGAAAVIRRTGEQRRLALLQAVATKYPKLPESDRIKLAATLDVLWSTSAFVQLVDSWGMATEEAVGVLRWAIAAINRADGRPQC